MQKRQNCATDFRGLSKQGESVHGRARRIEGVDIGGPCRSRPCSVAIDPDRNDLVTIAAGGIENVFRCDTGDVVFGRLASEEHKQSNGLGGVRHGVQQ